MTWGWVQYTVLMRADDAALFERFYEGQAALQRQAGRPESGRSELIAVMVHERVLGELEAAVARAEARRAEAIVPVPVEAAVP